MAAICICMAVAAAAAAAAKYWEACMFGDMNGICIMGTGGIIGIGGMSGLGVAPILGDIRLSLFGSLLFRASLSHVLVALRPRLRF